MKEWKLIRISDEYVSMVYHQEQQPEHCGAFGPAEAFRFESREMPAAEQNQIIRQRREALYPPLTQFADAFYHQSLGNSALMTQYLAECEAVKNAHPLVAE